MASVTYVKDAVEFHEVLICLRKRLQESPQFVLDEESLRATRVLSGAEYTLSSKRVKRVLRYLNPSSLNGLDWRHTLSSHRMLRTRRIACMSTCFSSSLRSCRESALAPLASESGCSCITSRSTSRAFTATACSEPCFVLIGPSFFRKLLRHNQHHYHITIA